MKSGEETGRERATRGGDETWPGVEGNTESENLVDLIGLAQLISRLDGLEDGQERDVLPEDSEDLDDTAPVPRIERMPMGVRVEERRVGRAVAQWVLQVRCECGRRWFEVDTVDTATCPRCGVLVYIDVDARSVRR